MNGIDNTYTDSTFNLYMAHSYTLLLQVEAGTFGYAVVDGNRLVASGQNIDIDELAHPKQLSDLLSPGLFKNVIIGMPATGLSLMPKSLFNAWQVDGMARLLDVKENEKVFGQTFDDQNMIIYKTPDTLVEAVKRFGLENTVYTAKGWIKVIADRGPTGEKLYIEISRDNAQYLYFKEGTVRFYNAFEIKNEEELVYFTLFVAEELQLTPLLTTLVLSGDISIGDKHMKRLETFFPKIELNGLKTLELPAEIPTYKIMALAALSLCGSSEAL
jgi:hypothetical protein